MELSRFNKKMIVLCEKSNLLWHPMLNDGTFGSLDEAFDEVFGIGTKRRAESWRKKLNPRAQVDLEIWSRRICDNLTIPYRKDLFEDSVRASEFSELLGIGQLGRRYLFDVFYSDLNKSSLSSLVFDNRKAEQLSKAYCGLYDATFICDHSSKKEIGNIDIRYFIPVGIDSSNSKRFKVRCKLDLPQSIETGSDERGVFFEYDGYLSKTQNWLALHFESRIDAWDRRSLKIVLPTLSGNSEFNGRFLKTPLATSLTGLSGKVSMRLKTQYKTVIFPHSNLQEVG